MMLGSESNLRKLGARRIKVGAAALSPHAALAP